MKSSIFGSLLFKLFVVLSLADLGLTAWLLTFHPNWVVESNPVANWWLSTLGIPGMALFKATTVLVVGLACQRMIQHRRLALSRAVLSGACLTVLAVVGYSVYLGACVEKISDEMADLQKHDDALEVKRAKMAEYRELVNQVCQDLQTNRTTLKTAVERLVRTEHAQDPTWTTQMKLHYGSESLSLCVAMNLITHFRTTNGAGYQQLIDSLENQLHEDFAHLVSISDPSQSF